MADLLKYLFVVVYFVLFPQFLSAQAERAQVVVAYVNNFARYTTWPEESDLDTFRIAVFTGDKEIRDAFSDFSKKRKIKNKPISLVFLTTAEIYGNEQMIFLSSGKSVYLPEIYNAIDRKPVLLVSEGYPEKRNVMANLYEAGEGQLFFEVNRANIANQGLEIDPEILLAGGTEIDVAGLYRSSQVSLRNMQQQMDEINDSLGKLNQNIRLAIARDEEMQEEIARQKEMSAEANNKLNEQQLVIVLQQNTLDSQKAVMKSQKDSIAKKNQVFLKQQADIGLQLQQEQMLEQVLKTKQDQIELLNREIESKNVTLGHQLQTITRQKNILFLFIVIGLLTFFLIVAIFFGYRANMKKNKILAKQKEEIEEKLAELRQLNDRLREADQYKSIFLASMSHELRTPLNSIIGYTGILLMGMTGKLNDEQNVQLTKVKNNAKHLLSLINDILDISKIEAGRVEITCEEVVLQRMANEVAETLHPKANEKKLVLSVNVPDGMILYTDTRRLKQVILNLAANAVNYTDSGEVSLSAKYIDESRIRFSVKDTGIGIADNELPRLFQPFQQIDSSLTKKNKGTGLGLYLCKKLMGMLGGDIFVKSEAGKGSEFYIEIPVKPT